MARAGSKIDAPTSQGKKQDLPLVPTSVHHPQPAALAFPAPRIGKTQLAQAASVLVRVALAPVGQAYPLSLHFDIHRSTDASLYSGLLDTPA